MTTADFSFLIFQANPHKDLVWYYVDGGTSRNVSKRDSFLNYAQLRSKEILPQLREATLTYSFHLWDFVDKKVILLHPMDNKAAYRDSIRKILNDGLAGKEVIADPDEKDPLTSQLYKFGFQTPNDDDVKNLRVELTKQKHTSFFTRIKRIFPANTTRK